MHPPWYYHHYQRIFGGRRYADEIQLISEFDGLTDKLVEEIGAGTGNHISHVLAYSPRRVVAVDLDCEAVAILRNRFGTLDDVEIVHAEGLQRRNPADVVICFYCIPQQARSLRQASQNLQNLVERAQSVRCALYFEWMDVDLHLSVNATAPPTELFRNETGYMEVYTEVSSFGATLCYRGNLGDRDAMYDVSLARLPISDIRNACVAQNIDMKVVPLSASHRRCILRLSRGA